MKSEYNIVLFSYDKESDTLLINVLVDYYKKIRIVQSIGQIAEHLRDATPKVILVSGEKFQDTLSTYYHALDQVDEKEMCEHFIVSLVSKRDETEAYDAYRSGIIDDYLVSRPLYEVHRPIVICEHLLVELGVAKNEKEGLEHIYKQEKYDNQVRKIVAKGLERKEQLKAEFEASLNTIETALDEAAVTIQRNQKVRLDLDALKATLSSIKSDQIRPELIKLQSKALNLLQKIVSDTNKATKKDKIDESGVSKQATIPPQQFNNFQGSNIDVDEFLKKANQTPKVLLVEDDPISVHLTSQLIESYKVELETAFTGRRALASIKNKQFDLIFLDINLPDTNGLYLLDQIKSERTEEHKPIVIMLTGNKIKATAVKAIELGAKGYIVKPMRKENFVNIFSKLKLPLVKKH
jgi:CheY-like chemotaxis protein